MTPQFRQNSDGSYSYGMDSVGWGTSFIRDRAKQKYESGDLDPAPIVSTPSMVQTNYSSGQQTPSGSFLSDVDAQELNNVGSTINTLADSFLQIRQQFLNAETQAEKDALAIQLDNLTTERAEAEKRLKEIQDAYGLTPKKYTTQQIIGIIALSFGGVALIGALVYFIIKKTKK